MNNNNSQIIKLISKKVVARNSEEAECRAILEALQASRSCRATIVYLFSDAQEIIKKITKNIIGDYDILIKEIRKESKKFNAVIFTWKKRDDGRIMFADMLARKTIYDDNYIFKEGLK